MAERRYNEWQQERLRGFEAAKKRDSSPIANRPQPHSIPSTSGN